MIDWKRLPAWVARAWPILGILPLVAVHIATVKEFPAHSAMINKVVASLLQIGGAMLVVFSINDNLGLFSSKSLLSSIGSWLKEFPRKGKPITISVHGSSAVGATVDAYVTVDNPANTLEEKIARAERLIHELQQLVQREILSVNKKIDKFREDFQTQISQTAGVVGSLTKRVESSSIGGIKFQIFGVVLAVYGALVNVIS